MTHIPGSFVSREAGNAGGAGLGGNPPGGPEAPDRPTPAELERVRARDPMALEAFFDRYFDRIFALAYRLTGDRASAEDAAQDVFLKVHRALDRLDPGRDPYPWLVTIATNVCRDLWRSGAYRMGRRAVPLQDEDGNVYELPSPGENPEAALLRREREQQVQHALAQLSGQLREAVVLHAYQGMGHDEIAEALGVKPAAQRKRYSRGLAALADILKDKMK